jgi:inosine/xanthosine triphosphate pyrophosphatase family protein
MEQIGKTQKAVEAAQEAAEKVHKDIHRKVLLADVSFAVMALEQLPILLHAKRYDAANMKMADLRRRLTQLRHVPSAQCPNFEASITSIIGQLAVLGSSLGEIIRDRRKPIDEANINRELTEMMEYLDDCIGILKYATNGGQDHDS